MKCYYRFLLLCHYNMFTFVCLSRSTFLYMYHFFFQACKINVEKLQNCRRENKIDLTSIDRAWLGVMLDEVLYSWKFSMSIYFMVFADRC